MANIRPQDLPAVTTAVPSDAMVIDGAGGVAKINPFDLADSTRPFANQTQAEAGTATNVVSSPLSVAQYVAGSLPSTALGRTILNAPDAATARSSLGLGGSAVLNVGTSAGTVAAGDDSRITGAAQKSANLSDLGNASTARTNLGLGNSATRNVGDSAGTVAAGDDIRFGGIGALASQAEAEAGVVNDKLMSPLRTKEAVDAQRPATAAGLSMLAAATAAAQTALLSPVVGDSGSGGTKGLVPAPAAGDAAADKYLNANGTFKAISITPTATGGIATPLYAKSLYLIAPEEFGALGNNVNDTTAVTNWLNALMDAPTTLGVPRYSGVVFPGRTYCIKSALPTITRRITILGPGNSSTSFIRDFTGTTGIGMFNFTANGGGNATSSKLSGFEIASASGTSGGALISIISISGVAVSAITLEDLWLTTRGTDTHTNTLYFDGTANTTGAIGVRDLALRNVHVFGANGYSVMLNGTVQMDWSGGGVYPAGGSGTGTGAIQFNGTAGVNTQQVTARLGTCGGMLLVNTQNCDIHSPVIGAVSGVSVNNASSAVNCMVYGNPSGTVLGNWTTSAIKRPGTGAFSAT